MIYEGLSMAVNQANILESLVDGQNSWKLGEVKMGGFEGYFGESDKIDGNWV